MSANSNLRAANKATLYNELPDIASNRVKYSGSKACNDIINLPIPAYRNEWYHCLPLS